MSSYCVCITYAFFAKRHTMSNLKKKLKLNHYQEIYAKTPIYLLSKHKFFTVL